MSAYLKTLVPGLAGLALLVFLACSPQMESMDKTGKDLDREVVNPSKEQDLPGELSQQDDDKTQIE